MYRARFAYVGFLLATIAAVAVCAGLYKLAVQDTRTVVHTRAAPALTTKSTVAQVRSRFRQQPQTMSGEQAGTAISQSCPQVDVYQAADGAVLICHA